MRGIWAKIGGIDAAIRKSDFNQLVIDFKLSTFDFTVLKI
jgi:hypothetical protein